MYFILRRKRTSGEIFRWIGIKILLAVKTLVGIFTTALLLLWAIYEVMK